MNSYQVIKTRLDQTRQRNEALVGQMTELLNLVEKATLKTDGRSPLRRKVTALRKTLSSFHESNG